MVIISYLILNSHHLLILIFFTGNLDILIKDGMLLDYRLFLNMSYSSDLSWDHLRFLDWLLLLNIHDLSLTLDVALKLFRSILLRLNLLDSSLFEFFLVFNWFFMSQPFLLLLETHLLLKSSRLLSCCLFFFFSQSKLFLAFCKFSLLTLSFQRFTDNRLLHESHFLFFSFVSLILNSLLFNHATFIFLLDPETLILLLTFVFLLLSLTFSSFNSETLILLFNSETIIFLLNSESLLFLESGLLLLFSKTFSFS